MCFVEYMGETESLCKNMRKNEEKRYMKMVSYLLWLLNTISHATMKFIASFKQLQHIKNNRVFFQKFQLHQLYQKMIQMSWYQFVVIVRYVHHNKIVNHHESFQTKKTLKLLKMKILYKFFH